MATSEASIVALFSHIVALKSLPRTGWLLAGVLQPESVADHSYGTAMLATFLCDLINLEPANEGLARPLDAAKVARMALVHDLAESVLTDLPKRAGELLGRAVKHEAERRAMQHILAGFPAGLEYEALWAEYEASATPEARLVHDADKLDMVLQARAYRRAGCADLDEFWQGHAWHFELSARIFAHVLDAVST